MAINNDVLIENLSEFWTMLRQFSYSHKTLMELFFALLYSFEQLLLVLLVAFSKEISEVSLYVSVFAIVILTTFTLQKFAMESRIQILENSLRQMRSEKRDLRQTITFLCKHHNEKIKLFEEKL